MKRDIKPKDIMTRTAFENALTLVMATGGSTNAVRLRLRVLGRGIFFSYKIRDMVLSL
jgi:dihydroxy-acid dehydratase